MDNWTQHEWHYEIHTRFGEQLVYYLLRIRPFNAAEIKNKLLNLLKGKYLESVRVYEIFGRNDILISAWLHPVSTREFPDWLKQALTYNTEIEVFTVRLPYVISSQKPELISNPENNLLDKLFDEEMVNALQDGHDQTYLKELVGSKIVLLKDGMGADPIKFFLTIKLSEENQRLKNSVSKTLFDHIKDNIPTIKNVSIYQGDGGLGHILLKADAVDNFFAIGELIEWILENLSQYEANTETFISALPNPLIETPDKISKATFQYIRGKDLFVQTIIPELYEDFFTKKDEIERFLSDFSNNVIMDNKKFVHNYLLGVLKNKNATVKGVLFAYFNELEEYLRENHKCFALENKVNISDIYKEIHYDTKSGKHFVLGELIKFYKKVLENSENTDFKLDNKILEGFDNLRNKPFHGDWSIETDWVDSLKIILKNSEQITTLLQKIKELCNSDYEFTYFHLD